MSRFKLIVIILLLIWISFFPLPIQEKYRLVTGGFITLVFVGILIRRHTSIFKTSDFPLWFFLITMLINVFFTQKKDIAFRTYIDVTMPMFLIYYLTLTALFSESGFDFLAKTVSILSILVSLVGILESLYAFNPIYEYFIENPYYQRYITGFVRPMSTQVHPVALGSFLLGCLPFNFLLFKQDRTFLRLLGIAGIVFNIVVIILTFSRSVFFGLIAAIMFYLFAQREYRSIIIFFISLLIFFITCSYLPYPFSRFGVKGIALKDGGIFSSYVYDRYIMAQRIIKDHPFVGLGFQHIRIRFNEYYPSQHIIPNDFNECHPGAYVNVSEFMVADNMYLTILAETGIIGFLGFFIFIFSLFRKALRQLEILEQVPKRRLQLLVIISAFIGLLVNMAGYELFYWPNQYIYFCILVGLLEAYFRNRKRMEYIPYTKER